MNDVGGSESGTGLRAVKSSRTSDANFEYDDSEWDVGIGNLIIDLDADIEKNNEANRTGSNSGGSGATAVTSTSSTASTSSPTSSSTSNTTNSSSGVGSGGPQQSSSASSSSQMHIPRSPSGVTTGNSSVSTLKSGNKGSASSGVNSTSGGSASSNSSSSGNVGGSGKSATTSSDLSKSLASVSMEHSAVVDKGLKMKIKRSKPGTKSVDAKHEIVKSDVAAALSSSNVSGKNSALTLNETKSNTGHGKEKPDKHDSSSVNIISNKGDDRDGNSSGSGNASNDQGPGGKGGKATKRGSTHKKVKTSGGTGSTGTSGNSGSSSSNSSGSVSSSGSSNKKDGSNSDSKSNSSVTSSSNSHVKDMMFSVNVGSNSGSTNTSAFVKTSSGGGSSASSSSSSNLKVPTPTTTSASNLSSSHLSDSLGSSTGGGTQTQGSAFRSHHSTSSNVSSPWASGSPAKGEKGQGRLSPSVTTPNTSEKISNTNNSPSYGKKPRVFIPPEKSSIQEDGVSTHGHGNISGSNNSPYRTSVTLSSASLNDLNASSCSSSIMHQGVPLQSGSTLLSSFNSVKDAKTGRIPQQAQQQPQQQQPSQPPLSQDVCVGTSVGTVTEPDCLGPCEPGTSVTLEGIVWHETESGVLVVNVTWRGKTYVGTLLDCTKNDWAPPRFCDSPTSDLEMRTPKNRGKRGRAQAATPVNEPTPADTRQSNAKLRNGVKGRRGSSSNSGFATPVSPLKPDPWPKRKTRGSENESQEETPAPPKNAKRPKVSSSASSGKDNSSNSKERQSNSPAPPNAPSLDAQPTSGGGPYSPALIECPEPNCSKKYKHINGLRYHQSHAHSNNFTPEDSDSNMSTASTTNPPSISLDANGAGNTRNNETVDVAATDSRDSSRMDVDTEVASATDGENTSSAPSTPAKRPHGTKDDKVYDINADIDINNVERSGKDGAEHETPLSGLSVTAANALVSLKMSSTLGKGKSTSPSEKEKPDLEPNKAPPVEVAKDVSSAAVTTTASSSVGRTPILTVPVPYMSLQNRPLVHSHGHHGHSSNLGNVARAESSSNNDKSNLNRDDLNVMKSQLNVPPSTGVVGVANPVTSKGPPWQPHAHAHSHSPHGTHTAHVISSLHPNQSVGSNPVPLTVPVIAPKDHEKNKSKDKSSESQSSSSSKKSKHKKKNKEKDRDRKDSASNSNNSKGSSNTGSSSKLFAQNPTDKPKDLSDKRCSSLDETDRDNLKGSERDSGTTGESRDDPQSPAYSDISDANDSGPEADPSVVVGVNAVKDNCVKNLVVTAPAELTNKKDSSLGIPPAHAISSFYPSFFSPYMDANNTSSNPPVVGGSSQNMPPKSDGNRSVGPEEAAVMEVKAPKTKSHAHMHSHGHPGHPSHLHGNVPPPPPTSAMSSDERRSPKVDYTLSSKYLAQHNLPQHYFPSHYPYSNYYDQQYGANMLQPESGYPGSNHGRVFIDEKERETQISSNDSRNKPNSKEKDEPQNLAGNIKQEPGAERSDKDRREKDSRSMSSISMDKEPHEIKSEFSETLYSPVDKRNLHPPQHFMPCSKHAKDAKRDDRHGNSKDSEKDPISLKSGRNSVESSKNSKSQNLERDRDTNMDDRDKDSKDKNEGAKPTMETQGPPPPPTAGSYAYIPQSYLPGSPFGLTFDPSHPLYRQVLVPGPYGGNHYMHPGQIPRYPPTPGSTPLPEDLSRPSGSAPPASKALDLLQHHAAQYYASHKIHELQERALKSPSPQVGSGQVPSVGQNLSSTPSSPGMIVPERSGRGSIVGGSSGNSNPSSAPTGAIPSSKAADLTKDTKPVIGGQSSESRSPPTQHHVHSHTHHHTHVGIGYPIIPTVPPQYSPHYGVLASPAPAAAVAASVITAPYPSQKPT